MYIGMKSHYTRTERRGEKKGGKEGGKRRGEKKEGLRLPHLVVQQLDT
jgi:hypothetical protein